MRIAVAIREDGKTIRDLNLDRGLLIFELVNSKVISDMRISAGGDTVSSLCSVLLVNAVDKLICGDIPAKSKEALLSSGIAVIDGKRGDSRLAVEEYLQ